MNIGYPRPEYIFRPLQIARRIFSVSATAGPVNVKLPWGHQICVEPTEEIGQTILKTGVYDLAVTETIYRLLEHGTHGVDVGANIGYMASIMAAKVGRTGKVIAFEPHPAISARLKNNVERWNSDVDSPSIEVYEIALSDKEGTSELVAGAEYTLNNGVAHLSASPADGEGHVAHVITSTLDKVLQEYGEVRLLKIDVEGHEAAVFRGGLKSFAKGQIRNVVFEEHQPLPTTASSILVEAGFSIFQVVKRWTGPKIIDVSSSPVQQLKFDPLNYVATLDPDQLIEAMTPRGWKSLGRHATSFSHRLDR